MVCKSRKKEERQKDCLIIMHMGWFVVILVVKKEKCFCSAIPFHSTTVCYTIQECNNVFPKPPHTHTHTFIYTHSHRQHPYHLISTTPTTRQWNYHYSFHIHTVHDTWFCSSSCILLQWLRDFASWTSHPILPCPVLSTSKELFLVLHTYIRIICPWRSATCSLSTTFANWLLAVQAYAHFAGRSRTNYMYSSSKRTVGTRNKRRISTAVLCSRSALFCSVLLLCSILLYYTTCDCLWNGRFPDTTQGWYCFKQDALFFIKTPPVRVVLVYTCSCSPCCIADRFPFSSLLSGTSRLLFKMWASCRTAVVRLLLSP